LLKLEKKKKKKKKKKTIRTGAFARPSEATPVALIISVLHIPVCDESPTGEFAGPSRHVRGFRLPICGAAIGFGTNF